jgi:hypothetical protein
MMACGVLSMHDAARAVDYETIVLLFLNFRVSDVQ